MEAFYRDQRKITPGCTASPEAAKLEVNAPLLNDQMEIGPTALALGEWHAAGLALPDLPAMRRYRHQRLVQGITQRDYGALLLFDPLNIRYATDSTNMQLWNAHNPFRAVLICADGYMVIWDYRVATFLSTFNPLVAEQRSGADLFYFDRGDKIADAATGFAREVADLVRDHGGGNLRLGADKIMLHGLRALESLGFEIHPGEELTEKARSLKSPDEIKAMRCAIHAGEASVAAMERFARANAGDGRTCENDIWAVLHSENIKRGGEWIETRLLSSGPRTNPWFQECGPRVLQPNEIVSFDTDLIGTYGFCVDISRSWWLGDAPPPPEMIYAMQHGYDHIQHNMQLLRPGLPIEALSAACHVLEPRYQAQKYGCMMHGVGLCDEWPLVAYPDQMHKGAFDYALAPGMVLCVEACIGEVGGAFSIKLEEQVLITETGFEQLSTYPFDPMLLPGA